MVSKRRIEIDAEPNPIIEVVEEKTIIKEEYYEWSFWTYLFFLTAILAPCIAWKISTDVYRATFYMTISVLISLFLVIAGCKSRKKIPPEYEIEIKEIYRYEFFCQKCHQYLGDYEIEEKGIQCDRCGSNRTTIYDPLKQKEVKKLEEKPEKLQLEDKTIKQPDIS